jgi:hypothetical protein
MDAGLVYPSQTRENIDGLAEDTRKHEGCQIRVSLKRAGMSLSPTRSSPPSNEHIPMHSDMQESVHEENLKSPKVGAIKAPNKDDKIKALSTMTSLPKYSNGRRPCHWETSPISEELHEADAAESAVVTGQTKKNEKGRTPKQMLFNELASQSMDSSLDVQAGWGHVQFFKVDDRSAEVCFAVFCHCLPILFLLPQIPLLPRPPFLDLLRATSSFL